MIVRLTGMVSDVAAQSATVERDDLAYEVLIPGNAVGTLTALRGKKVKLYTLEFLEGNSNSGNLVPRMIGFASPQDKAFFTRFIGVKGMGPRKALKALTEPFSMIARWIQEGDARSLARLPGIGARAAEMIIAELKGKMAEYAITAEVSTRSGDSLSTEQRDAREIMIGWGDARNDVDRWLEQAARLHPGERPAQEWVRLAYRIKSGLES